MGLLYFMGISNGKDYPQVRPGPFLLYPFLSNRYITQYGRNILNFKSAENFNLFEGSIT